MDAAQVTCKQQVPGSSPGASSTTPQVSDLNSLPYLSGGIGLLYKLRFDFPAGNQSRFGLLITVHDCQSMPGECDDVRAGVEQARAYPQLEYGACTVIVDEAAVAATAGQLREG
jgi:hypothetical protein